MSVEDIRLRSGNKMISAKMWRENNRIFLAFRYDKTLLEEVKSFEGAKWHGYDTTNPRKAWSITATARNLFQLEYLMGGNPYAPYDKEYVPYTPKRPLYKHQETLVCQGLTVHYAFWAAEMGTGKTLAAIELMEASGFNDWYWVGPKSALAATRLELRKWQSSVQPTLYTYEGLRSLIESWKDGNVAPHGVIFDESPRIKTPTAKRSQAAMQLADGVRSDWGRDGYIILMSGAPAPKSPADWYHQVEVACPGFLREGNINKFKQRLSIVQMREQPITGGVYPHLVTWLDNELKCAECGEFEHHPNHNISGFGNTHRFKKSVNEIEALYRRMKGLVVVFFKKDCLDLPDKVYRVIECKPTASALRTAEVLVRTAPRVITGLERLRELSDGFQYSEEIIGKTECSLCHGSGEILVPIYAEQPEDTEKSELDAKMSNTLSPDPSKMEKVICDKCGGSGEMDKTNRIVTEVPCPKIGALVDLLDQYSEEGRVVIYGGFTGSIDRIVKTCLEQEWAVLRADGRGWQAFGENASGDDMLIAMDRTHPDRNKLMDKYPRLAFVGQPGAAGIGLNLTASPVVIYYSNDFNADHRIQSEDRIHRAGMDENRGATIIDIVHLETDYKILENLKKKRDLQSISLGDFKSMLSMPALRDVDTIVYKE